jgi:hypothetical protein
MKQLLFFIVILFYSWKVNAQIIAGDVPLGYQLITPTQNSLYINQNNGIYYDSIDYNLDCDTSKDIRIINRGWCGTFGHLHADIQILNPSFELCYKYACMPLVNELARNTFGNLIDSIVNFNGNNWSLASTYSIWTNSSIIGNFGLSVVYSEWGTCQLSLPGNLYIPFRKKNPDNSYVYGWIYLSANYQFGGLSSNVCNMSTHIYNYTQVPQYSEIIDTIPCLSSYTFIDGVTLNNISHDTNYNVLFAGANGCDSIVRTKIRILPSYTSTNYDTSCYQKLYYFLDGSSTVLYQDNVHISILPSINACDSIVTEYVHVLPPIWTTSISYNICKGSNFIYLNGDTIYNITSSIFNHFSTLTSSNGCDSNIVESLIVQPTYSYSNTIHKCTGSNYTFPDGTIVNYLQADTNHISYFQTLNGCDSIITTHLAIHSPNFGKYSITLCANQLPYQWNAQTLSSSGTYVDTFTNSMGCDSVATLNLLVNQNPQPMIIQNNNLLICSNVGTVNYQWFLNNNSIGNNDSLLNISKQGAYVLKVIDNISGCEGTDTLQVTVSSLLGNDEISIYPNPTHTILHISAQNPDVEHSKKIVYNSIGQTMLTTYYNEIDVSAFSKGVYYIKIENKVLKLLVE